MISVPTSRDEYEFVPNFFFHSFESCDVFIFEIRTYDVVTHMRLIFSQTSINEGFSHGPFWSLKNFFH